VKGYFIGQRFIGEATGPHEVFRLQCENCGDVAEADSVHLGVDDDGVDLERPTCPKCGGTIQVFLKQTRSGPEGP
jgi:ribosomal protein S27AE